MVAAIGLAWVSPAVAEVDPASMVGVWLLDEGAGKIAKDSSGHAYDADLKGDPAWVGGRFGHALEFTGTNYLEIRNSGANLAFGGTSPFSITAWVKNQGGGTIMGKYNGGVIGAYIVSIGGGGTVSFHREVSPWAYAGTKPLPTSEFAHVAATYDGAEMKIYVNGQLDAAQARGSQNTDTATAVCIGARFTSGAPSEFFHGVLDEVALFDVALTEEDIQEVMKGLASSQAMSPTPEDEATDVPCDTGLGWTAAGPAVTHRVYFGTSWEDVNAASTDSPRGVLVSENQTETTYTPQEPLAYDQTYFWRVDEVNGAPDHTVFRGKIWSFTTEPFAYPIAGVTATASTFQAGAGPENTVNGSGLDAADRHGTELTDMWMTTGDTPAWIQFEFDRVYKLHQMWVWNSNQLIENFLGFGAKDVAVEYSADGTTWTTLEGASQLAKADGAPSYAANSIVDFGVPARFVRLTIQNNWGGLAAQTGLAEVRFFYVPVQARDPQPAVAATGVSVETELNWRPGREATSHEVFFGVDRDAVAGGAAASETVDGHSHTPADLTLATEYFWKVDEVGDAGLYPGDVWSFTTEEFAVVEDFESYDDESNRIYAAWVDGLTDQASGSQVGYDESPFAEMTVVHGGNQSMPLIYNNTDFAFSEAKRTFDEAQDWTARGVKTLSVHFAGAAGNTGTLYVKINNTKVVYDGDATDVARTGWHAWNVDLSKVTGNTAKVTSLTIGVEGSGAAGTLYVDDIRLSPKTPVFTTPVEPDVAGLVARYAFDGDVKDSSGKGRNGTANGGPTYVPGVDGQAIHLDGIDDYVAVGGVGISGAAPRTISGWVKADTTTITDWTNLFGFTSVPDGVAGLSFDMNKMGGSNTYCIHAYGWERNIMPIDLEWHHLAATYDGTTVAWYGDGLHVTSEAWVLNTQDNVQMGKRAHAAGGNFPGSIDEVRIYNKALSAEEIAWLAGRRAPVHQPL
jgi:hypothetical protein